MDGGDSSSFTVTSSSPSGVVVICLLFFGGSVSLRKSIPKTIAAMLKQLAIPQGNQKGCLPNHPPFPSPTPANHPPNPFPTMLPTAKHSGIKLNALAWLLSSVISASTLFKIAMFPFISPAMLLAATICGNVFAKPNALTERNEPQRPIRSTGFRPMRSESRAQKKMVRNWTKAKADSTRPA